MKKLILFYDTLWGVSPNLAAVPNGCEMTLDRARYARADAVVFHLPSWKWRRWLGMPQKLPGQLWVAWTMESDVNYSYQRDPGFLRQFDLQMTYRSTADVPLTYFGYYSGIANFKQALQRAPQPKLAAPFATAFISSRFNASGRLDYLRELMRALPIDSYGKFMQNKRIAGDTWRPSKLETIAHYKFTLAFENARDADYVTEKFYDPLVAGSVPVYLGAPNIERFAPGDHCYITTDDFATPRHLAEYLNELARDDAAYAKFFEWKQKPFRAEFSRMLEEQAVDFTVRLCDCVQSRLAK
jgi:hypothetical protein